MNYKYRYALLDNGKIVPLYYKWNEPRTFYQVGNNWYLDHLVKSGNEYVNRHSKIVKFLTKKEISK